MAFTDSGSDSTQGHCEIRKMEEENRIKYEALRRAIRISASANRIIEAARRNQLQTEIQIFHQERQQKIQDISDHHAQHPNARVTDQVSTFPEKSAPTPINRTIALARERRRLHRNRDTASELYERYQRERHDVTTPYRPHPKADYSAQLPILSNRSPVNGSQEINMCQGTRYWYNCPCPNPECPRRQQCELSKTLDYGHVKHIQVDQAHWERCADWHRQQVPSVRWNPHQNPDGLCANFVEPGCWHNYMTNEPMDVDCVQEAAASSQVQAGTARYGDRRVAVPFSLYPSRLQAISQEQAVANIEAKRQEQSQAEQEAAQRREAAPKFGRQMREEGRQEYLRQQHARAGSEARIQAMRDSLVTIGKGVTTGQTLANRGERTLELQPGAKTYRYNFDGSVGPRIWAAPGPPGSDSTQALTTENGIVRLQQPNRVGYVGMERQALKELRNKADQDDRLAEKRYN
ncbi:hypothetical protein CSOJ01_06979 [Colletotrichum sojae]|uniref:Uncharacterized protein n=1 Tax=Colletotrichum sojae TaxID=2175907 RepID=A0A8H6J9Z6_9PEZI|nr:hypothetical protein CSOJ01_06979 [Colletotrichum sojae]